MGGSGIVDRHKKHFSRMAQTERDCKVILIQLAFRWAEAELGAKHIVSIFGAFHKKKSESFARERRRISFTKNAKTCVFAHNEASAHLRQMHFNGKPTP